MTCKSLQGCKNTEWLWHCAVDTNLYCLLYSNCTDAEAVFFVICIYRFFFCHGQMLLPLPLLLCRWQA